MKSPEMLIATIVGEIDHCLRAVSPDDVEAAIEVIDQAPRVFVAGVGRSGLAVRAFAMRLMHLGKPVHVVGDVTTPGIREDDLLVIGSGSGSTDSLCVHARRAKGVGARILLVTIVPDSPIAGLADVLVRIPAPSSKAKGAAGTVDSRQPMGSLFEQSLFLLGDGVILALMQRNRQGSDEMFTRHANLE
jgi:6-phospho-3-hexuloisomerase